MLRFWPMNARQFLNRFGKDEAERVCQEANTTYDYFRQIASGARKPSWRLAGDLECASDQRMTRKELRPDIFGGGK